jgi:pimeloyl-ACP methyl ester carboxylesterase
LIWMLAGCGGQVHDHLYVHTDGAVLPVAVHGSPDAGRLVLFESGGPSGMGIGQRWVGEVDFRDTLEQHALVALYDRRGTGNAEGSYRAGDVTLERLVDDLDAVGLALRERYAPEQVVLMGHSFGGLSSMLALGTHPGLAEGYVAVAPSWLGKDEALALPYRLAFVCRVAQEEQERGSAEPVWQEMVTFCAENPTVEPGSEPHRLLYEHLSAIIDLRETSPTKSLGELLATWVGSHYVLADATRDSRISEGIWAEVEGMDTLPLLERIEAPTLLVTGQYDSLAPSEVAPVMSQLATPEEQRWHVQIDGGGHFAFLADPERFEAEVLELFARIGER